ncbi:hypothetical protein C8F04DRAFT_1254246 [Mycena alexandri]|uniref:Uncharacterized protein n=1 Tax=Mycena alexandri TaxID=1745969 RepID=A0AAD6X5U3_9AGAR|nr:hypothetical protein C8F04DRAFT_1254246 [Mycena alexandri]
MPKVLKDKTRPGGSPDNPIFVRPSPQKKRHAKSGAPGDSKENPLLVQASPPKTRRIFGGPPSAIVQHRPKTMYLSVVLRKGPPPPSPPTSAWSARRRAQINADAARYRAEHPDARPEPILRIRRRHAPPQPSIIDVDAPGPSFAE